MATYLETPTKTHEQELDWARDEEADVLTRAETAECACPDFCERDHDND